METTIEQRLELKNQALLEKISSLTMNYEDQVANLRVEVTLLSNDLQETQQQLGRAVDENNSLRESSEVSQEEPASEQG